MKTLSQLAIVSAAIANLTRIYGSQLEDMPLDDKLLALIAIAQTMREAIFIKAESLSFRDNLTNEIEATPNFLVSEGAFTAIAGLDECDENQCYALLVNLSNLAATEFRQFGGG